MEGLLLVPNSILRSICIYSIAAHIVNRMFLRLPTVLFVSLSTVALAQPQPPASSFEAASIRPSQHEVGPDYNNQISYSPDGFNGINVTLRRLIAEAWHCQINQVTGPPWLDHNEYDIAARAPEGATGEQMQLMLRALVVDRFHLKTTHRKQIDARV